MENRSIALAFDGDREDLHNVHIGIPPILFLIYIRFLFPEIKIAKNINTPSFIDDVAIYVESKSEAKNIKILKRLAQKAFAWADNNTVKFDDSKTELIHFGTSRKACKIPIVLPNGT